MIYKLSLDNETRSFEQFFETYFPLRYEFDLELFEMSNVVYQLSNNFKRLLQFGKKTLKVFNLHLSKGNKYELLILFCCKQNAAPTSSWQISYDFKYIITTENGYEGLSAMQINLQELQRLNAVNEEAEIGSPNKASKASALFLEKSEEKKIFIKALDNKNPEVERLDIINQQIQRIYKKCMICHYFISSEDICFQTRDNLFVLYNLTSMKETNIFSLNSMDVGILSPLAQTIEKYQNLRMILPEKSQFNYFLYDYDSEDLPTQKKKKKTDLSVVKINWFSSLITEKDINMLEFDSRFNNGVYYTDSKLVMIKSYNFYVWNLMANIREHKMAKIESNLVNQLLQVQYPNGRTLIHEIYNEEENLKALFSILKKGNQYLPILNDYASAKGENIFHRYLEFSKNQNQEENQFNQQANLRVIQVMEHLSSCPFNLCMIDFTPLLQQFVSHYDHDKDLQIILDFLLTKCKQIDLIKDIKKGKFDITTKSMILIETSSMYSYPDDFGKILVENDGSEQEIKVGLLDTNLFALLNKNPDLKFQLFDKITKCEMDNNILHPIVSAIINQTWKQIQNRIYIFVLVPYIAFMIFFYLYTIYDLETQYWIEPLDRDRLTDQRKEDYTEFGYLCRFAILLLILYFFAIDVYQIKINGFKRSLIWNFISLFLYLLVYIGEALRAFNKFDQKEMALETGINIDRIIRILFSFATLFLWTKFLYFFRVNKSTGYFIRMVIETFIDIISFLFIFFSIVICFAQAFYIFLLNTKVDRQMEALISESEDHTFDGMFDAIVFAYLMNFGVFNYTPDYFGSYQTWICWVFFVLAQISLTIVLLNFLIAIVNDTYIKIKERKLVYTNKDILTLMQENTFLSKKFWGCKRCRCKCKERKYCKKMKWLSVFDLYSQASDFIVVAKADEYSQLESHKTQKVIEGLDIDIRKFMKGMGFRMRNVERQVTGIKQLLEEGRGNRKEEKN